MKKICIVTWYKSTNYGSQFQATGLYKYLESKGYDVAFLNKYEVLPYYLLHPTLLISRIQRLLHWKKMKAFMTPIPYKISDERRANINKFAETNFKVLTVTSMKKWKEVISDNYIFVSGGDIIWQPALGKPGKYFLDFAVCAKLDTLAYGSSTGTKNIPKSFYKDYKRILSKYKAIGVREENTAKFFTKLLNRKVEKVLDPSLLMPYSYWQTYSQKGEINRLLGKQFILCYFVMEDNKYWEYVKLVEAKTNINIIVLPMHHSDEERGYECITNGVLYEFLWLIDHAQFVLTDSFHAIVASFLFDKEFYVMPRTRKDEDIKFKELLSRYSLEKRMIYDIASFERNKEIDYTTGKKILEDDRAKAVKFLENALDR